MIMSEQFVETAIIYLRSAVFLAVYGKMFRTVTPPSLATAGGKMAVIKLLLKMKISRLRGRRARLSPYPLRGEGLPSHLYLFPPYHQVTLQTALLPHCQYILYTTPIKLIRNIPLVTCP